MPQNSNKKGIVYSAECRRKFVAVKVLSFECCHEDSLLDIKKEVEVMSYVLNTHNPLKCFRKVSHPNLCLYMGICTGVPNTVMIITELYKEGLDKILFSDRHLSLPVRMRMALDVAMGMNWNAFYFFLQ